MPTSKEGARGARCETFGRRRSARGLRRVPPVARSYGCERSTNFEEFDIKPRQADPRGESHRSSNRTCSLLTSSILAGLPALNSPLCRVVGPIRRCVAPSGFANHRHNPILFGSGSTGWGATTHGNSQHRGRLRLDGRRVAIHVFGTEKRQDQGVHSEGCYDNRIP